MPHQPVINHCNEVHYSFDKHQLSSFVGQPTTNLSQPSISQCLKPDHSAGLSETNQQHSLTLGQWHHAGWISSQMLNPTSNEKM
jgi:hypothetical protein